MMNKNVKILKDIRNPKYSINLSEQSPEQKQATQDRIDKENALIRALYLQLRMNKETITIIYHWEHHDDIEIVKVVIQKPFYDFCAKHKGYVLLDSEVWEALIEIGARPISIRNNKGEYVQSVEYLMHHLYSLSKRHKDPFLMKTHALKDGKQKM